MKHITSTLRFILIALALTTLHVLPLQAQSAWDNANAAYAAGNYEEAIIGYENILQETPSAEVYYNLGNAYFKTGEIAHSILAYERCLRLNPQHKDAQFNRTFAESRIVDNLADNHQFFLRQWAQSLRNWLSESTWLTVAVVLFLLSLIGMLLFAFLHTVALRKTAFYGGVFAFVFSMLALWCGLSLHHRDMVREEAIITQGIVNAKSSPDKSGTDLFALHEGTKVRIAETVGEWCEIHVGDNIGWIRLSALERI